MHRTKLVPSLAASVFVLSGMLVMVGTAAGLGGLATAQGMDGWYQTLEKPAFSPPDGVFGPVWTTLYLLMVISAFLVWRQGWPSREAKLALSLFGIQLGLNMLWSVLFFGLQSPGAAFVELVMLWAAIAAWMAASWRVSRAAGALILPYLAWVTFAGVLNAAIWRLN